MPIQYDGPASTLFTPVTFIPNGPVDTIDGGRVSEEMRRNAAHAPRGACVGWGIPFDVREPLAVVEVPVELCFTPVRATWLVFLHTADVAPLDWNRDGFVSPATGTGRLAEPVAEYVLRYDDGTEARHTVRRRRELGMFQRSWGENCFEAVAQHKPAPLHPLTEQPDQCAPWDASLTLDWGHSQFRVTTPDMLPWTNWLWAWEHPFPKKRIVGLRIEPRASVLLLSGIAAGNVSELPYRWQTRRKAVLRLPKGESLDTRLDDNGRYRQLQIDLGQIISLRARPVYAGGEWTEGCYNDVPTLSAREVLVEYTAHPDARFHFANGRTVPVARLDAGGVGALTPVPAATQRVRLRVVDADTKRPVPVRLHLHGDAGEYLAPETRHRIPNAAWNEDYSVDFVHRGAQWHAYIDGETTVRLPLGKVYLEVTKGFEIAPVRKVLDIGPKTATVTIPIRRVLPWRARGWIAADTHVHFLSPHTCLLEGAAEGVNVVNLLATQWGELFTNIGDFDGKTILGAKESGGDGEHLVRVGTENRQHVLGHISLLGYNGPMIAPLTVGGPDESALGDPVEALLSDWARQCRKQGGLAIMPHFPNPRGEHASCIVHGDIDAVEMTSWDDLYGGINPYSLSDWYRYLNCGYFVPAVGGTDKMTAATPVGGIRTYARIPADRPFTYAAWMDAIRSGDTFATYGPLLEFRVEGKIPGQRIALPRTGGTLTVEWETASVTTPIRAVELIVNGEIRERCEVKPSGGAGHWDVNIERSAWLALLVRGHYPGRPEIVAAHSSPVMAEVEGSPFYAAADALTILEQIEGALAYLDTVATRAETAAYKRMRLILTAAHRKLHNQMHRMGHFHKHTVTENHAEHRR